MNEDTKLALLYIKDLKANARKSNPTIWKRYIAYEKQIRENGIDKNALTSLAIAWSYLYENSWI